MDGIRQLYFYPYGDLLEKRQLLESLNIKYRKPENLLVHGFNNPDECGVCLTNSVFALIMSSELLMAQVRAIQTANKPYVKKFMKIVKKDPFLEKKSPLFPLITQGDLLRDKLLRTSKGKVTHNTQFGFAGDYYLLKSYLDALYQNRRDKPMCPGNKVQSCYAAIRGQKVNGFPYEAWGTILEDLFNPTKLTKKTFEFEQFKMATYYKEINFLSLFWMEGNPQRHTYKRLPQNLLYMMNDQISQELTFHLENNKFVPKHIALNFRPYDVKELHPHTFRNFFKCLDQLKQDFQYVDRFECDELTVLYDHGGEKLPLNFSQVNFQQSFMYEGQKMDYKITGVAFASLYATENFVDFNDIIEHYAPRPPNISNDDLLACEKDMLKLLMDYIIHVNQRSDLVELLERLKDDLMFYMRNICYYKFDQFHKPFPMEGEPCHFITAIRRNDKWIILNDDFIIDIEDEELFWSAFKFEHVVSILLDKTDGTHTLDTITTINRDFTPSKHYRKVLNKPKPITTDDGFNDTTSDLENTPIETENNFQPLEICTNSVTESHSELNLPAMNLTLRNLVVNGMSIFEAMSLYQDNTKLITFLKDFGVLKQGFCKEHSIQMKLQVHSENRLIYRCPKDRKTSSLFTGGGGYDKFIFTRLLILGNSSSSIVFQ
ncbi:hypothetical protein SNEBB_001231 [Seison nebaliae]|nr:hypothetical protein SNEBB_001231 [Seison nebaliae]